MFDTAVTMAEFSAWANDKLYAACAQLSSSDFVAQRGAFFGSIVGTLNHILLVNILYRQRLENGGRSHLKRLDDTLHTDLDELRAAQRAERGRRPAAPRDDLRCAVHARAAGEQLRHARIAPAAL